MTDYDSVPKFIPNSPNSRFELTWNDLIRAAGLKLPKDTSIPWAQNEIQTIYAINSLTKTYGLRDMANIDTWYNTRQPFAKRPDPYPPQSNSYVDCNDLDCSVKPPKDIYDENDPNNYGVEAADEICEDQIIYEDCNNREYHAEPSVDLYNRLGNDTDRHNNCGLEPANDEISENQITYAEEQELNNFNMKYELEDGCPPQPYQHDTNEAIASDPNLYDNHENPVHSDQKDHRKQCNLDFTIYIQDQETYDPAYNDQNYYRKQCHLDYNNQGDPTYNKHEEIYDLANDDHNHMNKNYIEDKNYDTHEDKDHDMEPNYSPYRNGHEIERTHIVDQSWNQPKRSRYKIKYHS